MLFMCHESLVSVKSLLHCRTTFEGTYSASHLEKIRDGAIFKRCLRCNFGSFSIGCYYFHKKRCSFITNLVLHKHKNNLQAKSNQREKLQWFACDHCDYKTTRLSNLKTHKEQHTLKQLQQWFYCDVCSFKTLFKKGLRSHVDRKHTLVKTREPFQCEYCNFRTLFKHTLDTHIKYRHTTNRSIPCNYCDFKTFSKSHLTDHIKYMHLSKESKECLHCDECDFKAIKRVSLNAHKNIHAAFKRQKWAQGDQYKFKTSK